MIEAELFAALAHGSIRQRRKYTNEPYIVHPRNVAYLVRIVGGTTEMISAAYLHDVLEDVAPVNPLFNGEKIINRFGMEIFELVSWVSKVSKKEDGNRQVRMKIDLDYIASAPPEAMTIKLADLIDNSLTICEYDPRFAKIYLAEKRQLLNVLQNGNKCLWDIANNMLIERGY